jgi:hypothetical protein
MPRKEIGNAERQRKEASSMLQEEEGAFQPVVQDRDMIFRFK